MAKYELKAGRLHGANNQHKPGDVLELTPAEVVSFGDKFVKVEELEKKEPAKKEPVKKTAAKATKKRTKKE